MAQPAKNKAKPFGPPAGTVYKVSAATPKYVTADLEFRHPQETLWPRFFYGKPDDTGEWIFDPAKPKMKITVLCDKIPQAKGDQSYRLMGSLIRDGKGPNVRVTIQQVSALEIETIEEENNGKKRKVTRNFFPASGIVQFQNRNVPWTGRVDLRFTGKNKDVPELGMLEVSSTIAGKDLGLTSEAEKGPLQMKLFLTTFTELPKK